MRRLLLSLLLLLAAVPAHATTYVVTTTQTCGTGGGDGQPYNNDGLTTTPALPSNRLSGLAADDVLSINAGIEITGPCRFSASGTAGHPILIKSASAAACSPSGVRTSVLYEPSMGRFVNNPTGYSNVTVADSTNYVTFQCVEFKRRTADTLGPTSGENFFRISDQYCHLASPHAATCDTATPNGYSRWASLATGQPRHITLDRIYMHNNPGDYMTSAMVDNGMGTVIKDSWLQIPSGAPGQDTQVILCTFCQYGRWLNNHIQGGTEGIMTGADIGGPYGSDYYAYGPNHMEFVRNRFYKPLSENPRNAAYVPNNTVATVTGITRGTAGNTVVTVNQAFFNQGNSVNVITLAGITPSSFNGSYHVTTSVLTACSPCTITLRYTDTSAFSPYVSGGTVSIPSGPKNNFELKGCEQCVMDGNSLENAWVADNVGGGAQGGNTQLTAPSDTVGIVGGGYPITSVTCTNGVPVRIQTGGFTENASWKATALWGSEYIVDVVGVDMGTGPVINAVTHGGRHWIQPVSGGTQGSGGSTINCTNCTPNFELQRVNGTGCTVTLRSWAISSSTNATPIVLTTAAHGVTTGDYTYGCITGHLVNTNANGCWFMTALSATTLQLTQGITAASGAPCASGAGCSSSVSSSGNGVGGATGTVGPAVWQSQNRASGYSMSNLIVTNNYITTGGIVGLQPAKNRDLYASPDAFRIRTARFTAINNLIEDVDVEQNSWNEGCGVPTDSWVSVGNCNGATITKVLGGGAPPIDDTRYLHNTVTLSDQTVTQSLMFGWSNFSESPTELNGSIPNNFTFSANLVESGGYGMLWQDIPASLGANCKPANGTIYEGVFANCFTGTVSVIDNVLLRLQSSQGVDCTFLAPGYTSNWWNSGGTGHDCVGGETYLTQSAVGMNSTARGGAHYLTSSSLYKKGGARQTSTGCQAGVSWRRLMTARGFVPDPAIPAECVAGVNP